MADVCKKASKSRPELSKVFTTARADADRPKFVLFHPYDDPQSRSEAFGLVSPSLFAVLKDLLRLIP